MNAASFRIEPAKGIDRRACRMLLPTGPGDPGVVPLFVAKDERSGEILGAAGGSSVPSPLGLHDLRGSIHVTAPHRRRGVGTALLDSLADFARRHGIPFLSAMPRSVDRGLAMGFLPARGFTPVDRLTTFEARLDRLGSFILERFRWLRERGGMPENARIVPLGAAHVEPVAALYARAIGGDRPHLEALLAEAARRPEARDTSVLLVDGRVRGFLHSEFLGDLVVNHAVAVDDALRGGPHLAAWASLSLHADRIEESIRRGATRWQFSCTPRVRPTLRLAEVSGADSIEIRELLVRRLATSPA